MRPFYTVTFRVTVKKVNIDHRSYNDWFWGSISGYLIVFLCFLVSDSVTLKYLTCSIHVLPSLWDRSPKTAVRLRSGIAPSKQPINFNVRRPHRCHRCARKWTANMMFTHVLIWCRRNLARNHKTLFWARFVWSVLFHFRLRPYVMLLTSRWGWVIHVRSQLASKSRQVAVLELQYDT